MASSFTSADQVAQAAAVAPGFTSLFSKAPPQVTYKGKTYSRSAARNANEKVWYLAALAMTKPASVASLAYAGLDTALELDADRSALDAAKTDLRKAEAEVRKAAAQLASDKVRLKAAEKRANVGLFSGSTGGPLGAILGAATGGITTLVDAATQSGQVGWFKDRVVEGEQRVTLAKAAVQGAKENVKVEQAAYNQALRDQRIEEERERIRILEAKKQEAKELADERARIQAENAAVQAQADAEARAAAAQQAATYQQENQEPPIDYSGDYGDYGQEVFGDSEWLDADLAADVHGDADFAQYAAEASGELEGEASPYSFRQYYGCDQDLEHYCPAKGNCSQGWDDAADEAYGLEPNIIMMIIASILAIAPIILNALMPPPAAADSAENSGAAEKTIAGEIASLTGADKLMDEAAKKAGASAKPDVMTPALILGAIMLLA